MCCANDLFIDLGYSVLISKLTIICTKENEDYNDGRKYVIVFYLDDKKIEKYYDDKVLIYSEEITLEELQAINLKCKELGWL